MVLRIPGPGKRWGGRKMQWRPPAPKRRPGVIDDEVEAWDTGAYPDWLDPSVQRALRGFVNATEQNVAPEWEESLAAAALVRYLLTRSDKPQIRKGGNFGGVRHLAMDGAAVLTVAVLVEEGTPRTIAVQRAARKLGCSPRRIYNALARTEGK